MRALDYFSVAINLSRKIVRKFTIKYLVCLTDEERTQLKKIVTKGKSSAKEILHANILLATDDSRAPRLTVAEAADKCNSTTTTVQTIRKAYHEGGLDFALKRKKRGTPPVQAKITGEVEAHIIALACGDPPEGFSKWSLRLLADKAVELEYIENISYVSVGTL